MSGTRRSPAPRHASTLAMRNSPTSSIVVRLCVSCIAPLFSSASLFAQCGWPGFSNPQSFAVGSGPGSVTSADFDGDGDQDLAVATDFAKVSVLLKQGNGTFATHVQYPVGPSSLSVTSADFDGDGDQDLASGNLASNTVSVLLNQGD